MASDGALLRETSGVKLGLPSGDEMGGYKRGGGDELHWPEIHPHPQRSRLNIFYG